MKSTGIVRGIHALGRIVLPKELRTKLHRRLIHLAAEIAAAGGPMLFEHDGVAIHKDLQLGVSAVSYTHLDVYKRQAYHVLCDMYP